LEKTIFQIKLLTFKICMKLAHICRLEYEVGSWSSSHFQVWYKPRLKIQLSLNSAHMEKEISHEFHSFHSTFTKPNNNDNKVLQPKGKHTKIVHFTKQNFTQRTQKNEVYPLYLICQEKSVFARRIKFYLRRQTYTYISCFQD
jgi:hypothetical protein